MSHHRTPEKIGLFLIAVLFLGSASADNFVVSKTIDTQDGVCNEDCSLREAIVAANLQPGSTINIPAGHYRLDGASPSRLEITSDLTLIGSGMNETIIDGMGTDRVINAHQDDINPISLTISGLTITNGVLEAGNSGAGIQFISDGRLALSDVALTQNRVANSNGQNNYGGAIEIRAYDYIPGIPNFGIATVPELVIDRSLISENCAFSGAGINGDGVWTISNSTVSYNGTLTDCNVDGGGGGIYLNSGSLKLISSSVIYNEATAGGGVLAYCCNLEVENSTLAYNSAYGTTNIFTFSNFGGGGGAILSGSHTSIKNSTIVNNSAGDIINGYGGGVSTRRLNYNFDPYVDPYFVWAFAPGLPLDEPKYVYYSNSIIAENTAVSGTDCFGEGVSLGGNLFGDKTGCEYTFGDSDLEGGPGLDEPVDEGIPGSVYFSLHETSQAIDAGLNENCLAQDQRGINRPIDGSGDGIAQCDIGAFELVPQITEIIVDIDIKPDSTQNTINLLNNGVIPVAILSTDNFDVANIDTSLDENGEGKLLFSNATAKLKGKSGSYISREDVDGDGDIDLLVHFYTNQIDVTMLEVNDEFTYATISGQLLDGTKIVGKDTIIITNQ